MITIILLLTVAAILVPGGQSTSSEDETGTTCIHNDFVKSGCFKKNRILFSKLLITDLDATHTEFGKDVDWGNFKTHLRSLACRCNEKAHGKYKYFALGAYGECYAGTSTEEIKNTILNPGAHASTECIGDNGYYKSCDHTHKHECTGNYDSEYVYEVMHVETTQTPATAGYTAGGDGLYYKHHPEKKTWADASTVCKSEGAHLAIEDSPNVHSYMAKSFGRKGEFWIGLTDSKKEGEWVWVNGEILDKGYWSNGQPDNAGHNQDCLVYNWRDGRWDDQACESQKAFLCQLGTGK